MKRLLALLLLPCAALGQQLISFGSGPATGTGDNAFTAFTKVNANFNTLSGLFLPSPAFPGPIAATGFDCLTNFSNVGAVSALNTCHFGSFIVTGTQTANSVYAPDFVVSSDSYNGLANLTANVNSARLMNYNLIAGFKGNRDLLTDTMSIVGANTTADTSAHAYVNHQVTSRVNGFNNGGTGTTYTDALGSLWGHDVNMITQNGSTFWHDVTGIEIDNNLQAGSSVVVHRGIANFASATGAVRGTLEDSGILLGSATGALSFLNGLEFGSQSVFGFGTDSTLIKVTARTNPSYTAFTANYGMDFRQGTFTTGAVALPSAGVDAVGNVYGGNLFTGGSLTAQIGSISAITPTAYNVSGGYPTGGSYFASASFPTIVIAAPPNSGTQAAATVATMGLTTAGLIPGTDTGCTNGDVLTLTGGTGTQATITLTVVAGAATAAAVTTAGSYTALSATPGTTGGTCSVQPSFTSPKDSKSTLGFGILTVTVGTAGTNYPVYPLPDIHTTWSSLGRNMPAYLLPTMSTSPVTMTLGSPVAITPLANTFAVSSVGGSVTSGTTGMGVNIQGTVNDASVVDGTAFFSNTVCTGCAGGTLLMDVQVGGATAWNVNTGGSGTLSNSLTIGATGNMTWNGRAVLTSQASNTIRTGNTNGAAPVNYTIDAQGSRGGTDTNVAGANLTIQSGSGTGSSTGSSLIFRTPHTQAGGTTQQPYNTQLTLSDNLVSASSPLISVAGTRFSVASGTGACATSSTLVGGVQAGDLTCTAGTAASTVTLTLMATTTAYTCWGRDITTPTTVTQTGAKSTTSVTLTLTSVTTNDVVQFGCLGY